MTKLMEYPISKAEAIDIARIHLSENLGQTPVPGIPHQRDSTWIVPIDVCYPRMIFEAHTNQPRARRYLFFRDLAQMEVSAKDGSVIAPKIPTLEKLIGDQLTVVRTSVEKALTKVASREFARLHYAAHMTTPLTDIMSIIIMDGEIDTTELNSNSDESNEWKYQPSVDLLVNVGLIQSVGRLYTPGPAYVELEAKWAQKSITDVSSQLEDSIGYAFVAGYQHYDIIKRVIGTHLNVAGAIYENSIENNKPTSIPFDDLKNAILDVIGDAKAIKLNRYVVQLQEIGLIDVEGLPGERVIVPKTVVYDRLSGEDEILAPVRRSMSAYV